MQAMDGTIKKSTAPYKVGYIIYASGSVADPGCLSRIPDPTFFHPGSASKNLSILTKKWFLSSRKYDPGWSSLIPDSDADFLPIPDPGSRGQKGTGSRIRNTVLVHKI
jgi:hypothetical protein